MSTPTVDLKEVRRKPKKLGFKQVRSTKHQIWNDGSGNIVMLSHGNEDVGNTLLKSILTQISMKKKDFLNI